MNMSIADKCKGCNHFVKHLRECLFTDDGVIQLDNCICENCLIKTMCTKLCDHLYKMCEVVQYEDE